MKATPLQWTIFILYASLVVYAGIHHELWGDEVHSFNLAKASGSYSELLANRRYEGHPPAWYTLLWALSAFTHQVLYVQIMQWLIAIAIVWLILFRSSFSMSTKILLPFGYFFLFEYGVFSRNYALGVLFACFICIVLRTAFKYKAVVYYLLLFCLSNVHLLAFLLAISLHFYFLLNIRRRALHVLIGMAVLLPAAWFIHLPSGSEVDPFVMTHHWDISRLGNFHPALLRAFLPIPAWWNYHFWNTEFLLEAADSHILFRWLNPLIAIGLFAGCVFLLRRNKKAVALFVVNTLLNYLLSVTVFSLNTARHSGFIFIGFVIAWWMCSDGRPVKNLFINMLLVVQLLAASVAIYQDIRYPFSNTGKVKELISEIPANGKLVTDYWTMNAVVAFTDKPIYCVDMQEEMSFVLFDSRLARVDRNPHRYTDGLRQLFSREGLHDLYMISLSSPSLLTKIDPQLTGVYQLMLIDKRDGAIEEGSNLYLYKIHPN